MLHLRVENVVRSTWLRGEESLIKLKLTNDTGKRVERCEKRRFTVKAQVVDLCGNPLDKSLYKVEPAQIVVQAGGRCSFTVELSTSCTKRHYNGKKAHTADCMHKSMPTLELVLTCSDSMNEREVTPLRLSPIHAIRGEGPVAETTYCAPYLQHNLHEDRGKDTIVRIQEDPNCIMGGFGTIVWTASQLTARYIERNSAKFKGKKVLELGAGCGLCSIVSALCGAAQVVSTDVGAAYELLQKNVQLNAGVLKQRKGKLEVHRFDWNDPVPDYATSGFDFVLCTETFYSAEIVPLLGGVLSVICRNSERKATLLLAQSDRATLVNVQDLLTSLKSNFGFKVSKRVEDDLAFMKENPKLGLADFISKGIGKPQLFEVELS